MKYQFPGALVAVVLLIMGSAEPASAQSRHEVEKLRKEVQELKDAQSAMQKEIQEMRNLIAAGQARAEPNIEAPVNAFFDIGSDPAKGNNNAKLTLIELSDFQCGFCARHVKETLPELERDYIRTGKVKYVFRSFPLEHHRFAFKAAEAASCAGEEGKFWEMHDLLFANQNLLAPDKLTGHAQMLGLDVPKFKACLDSAKYAGEILAGIAEAKTAGVSATPNFVIAVGQPNDPKVKAIKIIRGAKQYEVFKAALDSYLTPSPSHPDK